MKKRTVVCHDMSGKLYKVNADKLFVRVSVYGVLIEKGKILLLKQKFGYDFPGGGMELHEKLKECLEREFWEETGLKVKQQELLFAANSFYYLKFRKKFANNILLYYRCKKVSGKLSTKNFDEKEKLYAIGPEWISVKDLKKITFQNGINSLALIKQALKK